MSIIVCADRGCITSSEKPFLSGAFRIRIHQGGSIYTLRLSMKPIPEYEGLYSITECGRVYSHKTSIYLKQSTAGDGYSVVFFYSKETKKNKGFLVHRLVAISYVDNSESKPQVNHIDGDKSNNHASNLEWCTRKENAQHAIKLGLRPASPPEGNLFKKGFDPKRFNSSKT